MDTTLLARIQFAITIMFHYLFPPLSIGLGTIMAIIEGLSLKTKDPIYETMGKFWTKMFAITFALGVATGIVMEFEFGTNWASYSRFVGDIFGSALASEGIFAFFLESGFLALLVFGWDKVSPRVHFIGTVMVALGSTFSAIWIVIANAWMQTPRGFHIVGEGMNARAEITDFWEMVFNPSSLPMLVHTLIGAWLMGSFFVMSISAYYLLKKRHEDFARKSFQVALVLGFVMSVAALFTGHMQAQKIHEHQPAKLAAFEGHFHTNEVPAPLHIFGIPNEETETVDYAITIPGGLGLLVHGDANKPVIGLDKFPKEDRPPVKIPFFAFHTMVAMGMFAILLTSLGMFFWLRKTLFQKRWLLSAFVPAVIAPLIANEVGWVATEVGRQPWIVYGVLRTPQGISKVVKQEEIIASIILFCLIYLLLFFVWLFVLHVKIKHGPDRPSEELY